MPFFLCAPGNLAAALGADAADFCIVEDTFPPIAASIRKPQHLAGEGRIVEIGRQPDSKAIKSQFTTNDDRFLEIHAGCPLRRDQFDKRAAIFGDHNALAARGSGGFSEAGFSLAYR